MKNSDKIGIKMNQKYGILVICVVFLVLCFVGTASAKTCFEKLESPETPTLTLTSEVTIVITSTTDSGPGTLRQALLDAQSGNTITFDTVVFPPKTPSTIYLTSSLLGISQGNLAIDASNAGVILDGSNIQEGWIGGLEIISGGNTIQGLQVVNFSGAGIVLSGGAQNNTIGGDRSIGSGPLGQGNLASGNNIGIGIWGDGTSSNTITGNLIGTDATGAGALGNNGSGIWVSDGASRNIIGPDNIIAYNNVYGIEILDSNSFGNTITQNSIHDNERGGIYLWKGGNTELSAPFIFDFDLATGTVTGTACTKCTIEIFSDTSNQGGIYEGQTTANGFGVFIFNKGTSFTGPHLTATTTDADGNTSEFSVPTSGPRKSTILQEGNNLPKTQFQTKQSRELADNRIGGQWDSLGQYDLSGTIDTEVFGLGLKRVRLAVSGTSWDHIDWSRPELYIDPTSDDLFSKVANNGVTITYVLSFWDKAAEQGKDCPRFRTQEEIQRYLDFVRFIVYHFKDRVQYFEIWNEPDIGVCIQRIEVDDYINLTRQAIPVIRQEYPEAKIIVGAVIPFSEPPYARDYFFNILRADVMPLVDAVSWHCHNRESPEYAAEYYFNYPFLVQEIKDLASAHGFKGEYIAEEVQYQSLEGPIPNEPCIYTETVAAKYYARSIVMHLGMDVTVGLAGISSSRTVSFPTIRNLCTVMAGAEPISLPIEIQSEATNIRSYSFSLPNGDHLVALWTDGVAVDEDPGVKANLTFQGFTAQDVMGIDVLNGFQQPIITSNENGNLTIQNLIVRDYPLILAIANVTFDTGSGTYPSIMGTHKGKIIPSRNISVSRLYTYPCAGTGGHTESIKLYENGEPIASGTWSGYQDDWHYITITPSVILFAGHTYNYTIVTGSYPQIIHEPSKDVTGGTITCDQFIDANGVVHYDWIPAIRLYDLQN